MARHRNHYCSVAIHNNAHSFCAPMFSHRVGHTMFLKLNGLLHKGFLAASLLPPLYSFRRNEGKYKHLCAKKRMDCQSQVLNLIHHGKKLAFLQAFPFVKPPCYANRLHLAASFMSPKVSVTNTQFSGPAWYSLNTICIFVRLL